MLNLGELLLHSRYEKRGREGGRGEGREKDERGGQRDRGKREGRVSNNKYKGSTSDDGVLQRQRVESIA